LPRDKIELTEQQCSMERVTRNIYGVETSRECVAHTTVPTGVFVKPSMHEASSRLVRQQLADAGRQISQMAQPDGLQQLLGLVADSQVVEKDMQALVQLNRCTMPALMRFEENLRLFALNRPPIRLNGDGAAPPVDASRNQDYRRLIADLVLDDAKRWGAFAKLVPDSVTGAAVAERDGSGRPLRVVASYSWDGLLGRSNGSVTLTLADGVPECLTYSETPSVCHTPGRGITANYLDGSYAR
jgi:hypothetical protein